VSPFRVSMVAWRQLISRTRPIWSANRIVSPGSIDRSTWSAIPDITFDRVSWREKPMTAVTMADVATRLARSTLWIEKR
jgi:hypothetical protein